MFHPLMDPLVDPHPHSIKCEYLRTYLSVYCKFYVNTICFFLRCKNGWNPIKTTHLNCTKSVFKINTALIILPIDPKIFIKCFTLFEAVDENNSMWIQILHISGLLVLPLKPFLDRVDHLDWFYSKNNSFFSP